mmetsp:Transcript_12383/g.17205  ORF Transcript_12383/g.17205 Transcript_12383/m.17205 type:complete len:258 (-) Transcript_12383:634-1407(-)
MNPVFYLQVAVITLLFSAIFEDCRAFNLQPSRYQRLRWFGGPRSVWLAASEKANSDTAEIKQPIDLSIGEEPVRQPDVTPAVPQPSTNALMDQQEEEEEEEGSPAAAAAGAREGEGAEEPPYFYARDFVNSTWTVAIAWNGDQKQLQKTKVFLRDDGTCVWLNGAEGTWRLNTRRRSISIYRNFKFGWGGKRIFSTSLLSPQSMVYLEDTVKGWAPWCPAKIWGYFQAVRQGVDIEKYGLPPWYEENPKESITASLD